MIKLFIVIRTWTLNIEHTKIHVYHVMRSKHITTNRCPRIYRRIAETIVPFKLFIAHCALLSRNNNFFFFNYGVWYSGSHTLSSLVANRTIHLMLKTNFRFNFFFLIFIFRLRCAFKKKKERRPGIGTPSHKYLVQLWYWSCLIEKCITANCVCLLQMCWFVWCVYYPKKPMKRNTKSCVIKIAQRR